MEWLWQFGGLFVSAFVSATLLPAASEAVLVTLLYAKPEYGWMAWAVASLGNTLGSLTSYAIGFRLPEQTKRIDTTSRAMTYTKRYGVWILLLSWLPIVGDALPLLAGWLRLNVWWSALMIALGKMARYGVIWASVAYAIK